MAVNWDKSIIFVDNYALLINRGLGKSIVADR